MRFSPGFLEELRGRLPLSELISRRGVKLQRRGWEFVGLCPFHSEKTPFGCGAHGDAIDFIRRADNCDFTAAISRLAGAAAPPPQAVPPLSHCGTARRPEIEKLAADRRRAGEIWDHSGDPRGTLAEIFLASRELTLPPAPEKALRFAPACEHGWTHTWPPAMLARITGPDGAMIGLHRTYLRGDGGGKAAVKPQRAVLGSRKGGAVRLGAVRPDRWLIVAEGIETTLAAMQAYEFERPGWAALCDEGIESLALPCEAGRVLIVADHDHHGIGERRARVAGERFLREGRRVRFWRPPEPGTDANDVLMGN